jgi:hypothetical protein
MHGPGNLRHELSFRNLQLANTTNSLHEVTNGDQPSVIFGRDADGRHGNFHPTSYRNIQANPAWASRLKKVHTGWRKAGPRAAWQWMELDCANSSDALLMNIFCYQRTVTNPALTALLGVDSNSAPEFGFRPRVPLDNGKVDRTEIDMRLGNLLVEAKLTESDFQTASIKLVERYRNFAEVFDATELPRTGEAFASYQLIRGALAAHATGGSFCVLSDARRPDLIEKWHTVMRAVKSCTLRCRLHVLTWQELATALPKPLQKFLTTKYGIGG